MSAPNPALVDPTVAALLARCPFPPPSAEVTCAVSGGADSLALLALACAAGCDVTAVHVDHGLRAGSAAEADVVAAADRLGARFRAVTVQVEPGPNLEARARVARYAALPADVLTGHTADDQAETLLLHLLRGAGLDGLAAMRPGERRPLLGLRRADTESVCAALGLEPVHDPSNLDPAFRRNRVRHEVLPLLADVAERDVVPLLVRLADLARSELDHLEAEAAPLDVCDARALSAAPPVIARRAVRNWLRRSDDEGHPPDRATVARVLGVAAGEATGTDVGGGRSVRRTAGRLRLEGPAPRPTGDAWGGPASVR